MALTVLSFIRKVSTIAVVSAGERMFVGTGDGSLTAHECRGDTTNALKAGSFECREVRGFVVQNICQKSLLPFRFVYATARPLRPPQGFSRVAYVVRTRKQASVQRST